MKSIYIHNKFIIQLTHLIIKIQFKVDIFSWKTLQKILTFYRDSFVQTLLYCSFFVLLIQLTNLIIKIQFKVDIFFWNTLQKILTFYRHSFIQTLLYGSFFLSLSF